MKFTNHNHKCKSCVFKKLLPIILLISSCFWIVNISNVFATNLWVRVCVGDSPDCPTTTTTTLPGTTTTTTTTIPGTTSTTRAVGGGGGGGGGVPPISGTKVAFSGLAYPNSKVYILKNGVQAIQTISGPDAKFQVDLNNISEGNYNFSVWTEDVNSIRSLSYSFSVHIMDSVTTSISGILLPPTVDVDKVEVKKGDPVTVLGQTIPNGIVNISINSTNEITDKIIADKNGSYRYIVNSSSLEYGNHEVKTNVYAVNEDLVSNYSSTLSFVVGTKNVLKTTTAPGRTNCPAKGDVNGDCQVNLTDFSILAYWYGRGGNDAAMLALDKKLYDDGKIDLRDFSIMAYYWTG